MQRNVLSFFKAKKSKPISAEVSFEFAHVSISTDVIKLILQQMCQAGDAQSVGRMARVNLAYNQLIKDTFADAKLNPEMSRYSRGMKLLDMWPTNFVTMPDFLRNNQYKSVSLRRDIYWNSIFGYVVFAALMNAVLLNFNADAVELLTIALKLNMGLWSGAIALIYFGHEIVCQISSEISGKNNFKEKLKTVRFLAEPSIESRLDRKTPSLHS